MLFALVLDDFYRYIIAWKLCTTMKAGDVTATLEIVLEAVASPGRRPMYRKFEGRRGQAMV